ncbi:MAG: ATP-binding cassette domain-containing protein [Allosphingosinicella sp.]
MQALRTLYRLMTGARRRHLAATLALMLLGVVAEMVTIGAVMPLLALAADADTALVGPRLRAWLGFAGGDPLVGAAVLLVGAAIAAAAVRLLLAWASNSFVMKLGHEVASAIFSRMLRQPYAVYLRRNSSEILSGIEKVQPVVSGLLQPAMQGTIATGMGLFVAILLFFIDPMAAGIGGLSILVAYAAMSRVTRYRLRGNARIIGRAMTDRTKIVQEGLGGIRDIMIERSQPLFEQRFRAIDARLRRAVAVNAFIAASPRFVIEAAAIVAIALVTLAMSVRPGGIVAAIPVLGALALGAQRLLPLIQTAWHGWTQASGNVQLLKDIAALIETAPEPVRPPAAPLAFRDGLVFDAVSFRYEGGAFALRDVSIAIGRGERVGIAGTTGSGKSTLLDLLMGLLDPDEGAIRIDGKALDDATRPGWQAAIAHVPQAIYLADDSIAANIAFAAAEGGIDMARVRDAARAACLADFIESLPDGYETTVGERGIRLSGGQRQRIGLARALYKGTQVLILDEATSALDEDTERAVLATLAALPGDLTIIMVAHRSSTLDACDRRVRLEGGRLVG